jgi:hypothetical protein
MKQLFFAAAILATSVSFGQNTFPAAGNVGIGTTNPNSQLAVISANNGITMSSVGTVSGIGFNRNVNDGVIFNPAISAWQFTFRNEILTLEGYNGVQPKLFSILKNGNFGIGSTSPDERLTVKGKIHAEEVRVDLLVPADYVFEKYYTGASTLKADYVMPSLAEVEKYTKANNHLPNVPSAQEIKNKGLQLGEMSNVLLQKVEELTLYIIEQNKKIEALEAKVNGK